VETSINGSTYAIGGLNVKGSVETLSAEVRTAEDAQAMLASDGSLARVESKVGEALSTLETNARQLGAQMTFNTGVENSRQAGLGALVDADLAQESAHLQSLQIRQQLGTQSLSIANQAPQMLLSLFR
jgi:flagellin